MFGFTGTPVFATKVCAASGAKPFTTAQTFGYQLHTYTIVGAIDDKNVLPLLNARALQQSGAALMIEEKDLTDDEIIAKIESVVFDPVRQESMRRAAKKLGHPDAAGQILDWIEQK